MTIPSQMFEAAKTLAQNSPDPSTKVGCVIANQDWIRGEGFNDLLPGLPREWWDDRSLKYKGVVHAEVRAVADAMELGEDLAGTTAYVTQHPCKECAKLLIAVGVKQIVCPSEPWRDDPAVIETVNDAKELFRLCGVSVTSAE